MTCAVVECSQIASARGWCQKHYMRWRKHGDPTALLRAENGEPVAWIRRHATTPDGECLIWPFGRAGKGYAGPVWPDGSAGRCVTAGRYMCELVHGPAPTEIHETAHSCGNGAEGCIHPLHMRWATPRENDADKTAHGTRLVGINQPGAKLDDEKVRAIRSSKGTQQSIADRFGVSRNAVRQVLSGRTWGHVK
jgi:hypothetical protein